MIPMSVEENKAIARRWNDEIWSQGSLTAMDELFAPGFVSHYPGDPTPNRESYKQWVAMNFAAFADVKCTIEDIVAEGDKVVVRWTWRMTHSKGEYMGIAPTGKQVTMTGMCILRIVGGKIVEEWGNSDDLGFMQQLGAIPSVGGTGG
jgi:predicted ester cyclase